ncbi:DUF1045 domain-containing protein [Rhizobium helianthi]|uniref:DUF1045 domain-containing protein n=1 Tax=Rhizobium helianthi TaxID=1132695 RepID=A0ABW4LZF8_9HYPH
MRYAVYFTPPEDHPLTRAASHWLGRNAFSARTDEQDSPCTRLSGGQWQELVSEPARYGFHATLKAPFRLSEDRTAATLGSFFEQYCAQEQPATIPRLELAEIGPFFALTCAGGSEGINALCDRVVRAFEPWRAPLSVAELAKRRPESLKPRQRDLLQTWGYPYVFEEFRFHMTLTGAVAEDCKPLVRSLLEEQFSDFLGKPLAVEHLGLFVEHESGQPFYVQRCLALKGRGETA